MKRFILLAALMLAAGSAAATCPHGGHYPNCNPPPPTTPPPGNDQDQDQDQRQRQGQQQGQGQHQGQTAIGMGGHGGQGGKGGNATGGKASVDGSGNSRNANRNNNTATSGSNSTSGASSASGVDASGNSAVSIDQSDRGTYSSRSSFVVMSDLPANAMNIVPGAMLTSTGDTQCGYLQAKVRTPIRMWISKRKQVEVGYDEDIVPFRDANGVQQDLRATVQADGSTLLSGHMVLVTSSALSSASNFQLGAQGGRESSFGGLGYGSGSGQQQIGQRIILRDCRYGVVPVVKVAQAAPVRKAYKRKAVKRRSAPAQCVPRPAKVCPAV